MTELEVVDDLLHVRREAIEVRLEVLPQARLVRSATQVFQGETRRVVEVLPRGAAQRTVLVRDTRTVERLLHLDHRVAGRLEHAVEAAQHRERQNHVAILAAHVEIAQHIIGDAPDQRNDPGVVDLTTGHGVLLADRGPRNFGCASHCSGRNAR